MRRALLHTIRAVRPRQTALSERRRLAHLRPWLHDIATGGGDEPEEDAARTSTATRWAYHRRAADTLMPIEYCDRGEVSVIRIRQLMLMNHVRVS